MPKIFGAKCQKEISLILGEVLGVPPRWSGPLLADGRWWSSSKKIWNIIAKKSNTPRKFSTLCDIDCSQSKQSFTFVLKIKQTWNKQHFAHFPQKIKKTPRENIANLHQHGWLSSLTLLTHLIINHSLGQTLAAKIINPPSSLWMGQII